MTNKPTKITAWKCAYCNMTSIYISSVTRHQNKWCRKNRHCSTCEHLESYTVYDPHHGGNPGISDYESEYCNAKEEFLQAFETNCPLYAQEEQDR